MKKEFLIVIILAAVIIALLAVWAFLPGKNNNQQTNGNQQNAQGIQIDSLKEGDTISSPIKIKGTVNGSGWTGFEGQVGTVKILDSKGESLGMAILNATTDWMKPQVSFEANLAFQSATEQAGTLVFNNENASGLPENDKQFAISVKIVKTSGQLMTVLAYFNNEQMDSEYSCNKVFPVQRQVQKSPAVARAALEELLKGPTQREQDAGFFTSINSGVKIQKLTVENGTAYVDFDSKMEEGMGGSCRVSAVRAEITQTLKQFPTVQNVVISVDGRTEDILQP